MFDLPLQKLGQEESRHHVDFLSRPLSPLIVWPRLERELSKKNDIFSHV